MASDITDVLVGSINRSVCTTGSISYQPGGQVAALAAATADGPLVEDVPCGTCEHALGFDCLACAGDRTVRIVVITEAMLRERLADALTDLFNVDDEQLRYAAARTIGGEHG